MNYEVYLLKRAQKALSNIYPPDEGRLRDAIRGLGVDPRSPGCRTLTGPPGRRLRVGEHRVIYEIDNAAQEVTVLDVGHRRDVYR